jgi:hypothetical protein
MDSFIRRTISVCWSVSMSLAGWEMATKLPGAHAATN